MGRTYIVVIALIAAVFQVAGLLFGFLLKNQRKALVFGGISISLWFFDSILWVAWFFSQCQV